MSWAKCSECDQTFGSDTGFDRHRVNVTGQPGFDPEYDWRCATAAELLAKGMRQDDRGWWRLPDSGSGRRGGSRTAPRQEVA